MNQSQYKEEVAQVKADHEKEGGTSLSYLTKRLDTLKKEYNQKQ